LYAIYVFLPLAKLLYTKKKGMTSVTRIREMLEILSTQTA